MPRTLLVLALTAVIAIIFHPGEGYDWSARVGTLLAILQRLLLLHVVEGAGERATSPSALCG
ncbi:MAG: hypothetical protein FJ405_08520 [Verrucomicrobia bacterium]|nr:hypothetical protein [Verrucomicrobiota bacterium]